MSARRRTWLRAGLAAGVAPLLPATGAATVDEDAISPERALRFPRDHGAHPGARIEWWYATGWLQAPGGPPYGFQLTFFRSRTGVADALPGRFAPRQLLFAHAAVTDLDGRRHRHAERIARWSGDEDLPEAHARRADTGVALGRWTLRRDAASGRYAALLAAPEAGFTLDLQLAPTQPLLLQGDAGHSRKGPLPQQASHYYSQPQLAVQARLTLDGRSRELPGRGWLDHEWSDELLAPGAVGWDWIGINLSDGGALTAFRLRRADDSVVWAGGSHRPAGGALRPFAPDEVVFTPLRDWTSPATGARYPVQWRIRTPAGVFGLRALLEAQELDSRASTGTVYWEGLAELADAAGGRVGLGYLEMTGRGQPLKLGL
ncbi:MAG: carotenoid 1,2-hydratase [Burkholderiaceae bacterium]|nr:carotenoid 1,2-hydratase [Burkholderiaceae bacterium]